MTDVSDKLSFTASSKKNMATAGVECCDKESFDFNRLSRRLGGIVLKREQKEAVSRLLEGKDVFAVLPTGFGKSLIYQSFVLAKSMEFESRAASSRPCCLVIVPLRSIMEEQIKSNDFELNVVGFSKSKDVLDDIRNNKFQLIYASAEQALSSEFLGVLRDPDVAESLSLIVVDESHTVETW